MVRERANPIRSHTENEITRKIGPKISLASGRGILYMYTYIAAPHARSSVFNLSLFMLVCWRTQMHTYTDDEGVCSSLREIDHRAETASVHLSPGRAHTMLQPRHAQTVRGRELD